jgi:hypothetical protein
MEGSMKTLKKWGWSGFRGNKRRAKGIGAFSLWGNSIKRQDLSSVLMRGGHQERREE